MLSGVHVNPSFPKEPAGVHDEGRTATDVAASHPHIVEVSLGAANKVANVALTNLRTVHQAVDGGVAVVSAVLFPLSLPLYLCRSFSCSRAEDPAATSHSHAVPESVV